MIKVVIAIEVARRSRSKPEQRFLTSFGTGSAISLSYVRLPRTFQVLAMTRLSNISESYRWFWYIELWIKNVGRASGIVCTLPTGG